MFILKGFVHYPQGNRMNAGLVAAWQSLYDKVPSKPI